MYEGAWRRSLRQSDQETQDRRTQQQQGRQIALKEWKSLRMQNFHFLPKLRLHIGVHFTRETK